MPPLESARIRRAAVILLTGNATVVAISVIGILLRPHWPWPNWDFQQIAMVAGIANIVTAFFVSLLLMGCSQGWRATAWLFVLSVVLGGGAELMSTATGIPFGNYEYTEQLGPKIFGRVPLVIILAWFVMLYPALHIAFFLRIPRMLAPLMAGALLTLWDVSLEAAMTTGFACWTWESSGGLYGVPLQNWAGWFLTGWLLGTVYLLVVKRWRTDESLLPVGLYFLQGSFAALLALIYGRELACAIWLIGGATLIMSVSAAARGAWRRERHASEQSKTETP